MSRARRASKRPTLRPATAEEFDDFLSNYPRPLQAGVNAIGDPPLLIYNDSSIGDGPNGVVAYCCFDDHIAKPGAYRLVSMGEGRSRKESNWHIPVRPHRMETVQEGKPDGV